MRTIIWVAAAALLVSGCETEEGWVPGESHVSENPHLTAHVASAPQLVTPAPPAPVAAPPAAIAVAAPPPAMPVAAPPPPAPSAPPPTEPQAAPQIAAAPVPNTIDTHCRAVAHQRASDARANGFSFRMTDLIYEGTYKDCVAWDAQHGTGVTQ